MAIHLLSKPEGPFWYFSDISHIHRITEWLRLQGTPEGPHLVKSSCSSWATYSWLPRTMPRQVLNITKDRGSTTSLSRLYQCSVILTAKNFPDIWMEPSVFLLCLLPLVLSLDTIEERLPLSSLQPPFRNLNTLMTCPEPSLPPLLKAKQS